MAFAHTADLFDGWAVHGRGDSMARGHWPAVSQILPEMGLRPGMTCLDVGCGNGYAVRAMARQVTPGGSVCGVDVAPLMVQSAQDHPDNPENATYLVAPGIELPFDDASFDRILSVEAIYYMPDIPDVLREWVRVLKPGGSVWVMVDFYRENPYSACWADMIDTPMQYLGERDYVRLFEEAGLSAVRTRRLMNPEPVDEAGFTSGWGYETADDVRHFRTEIGSLMVTGQR